MVLTQPGPSKGGGGADLILRLAKGEVARLRHKRLGRRFLPVRR
ncbi:MAG TPA: hypothetical protein VGS07_04950 [Thermoanaerobaculia bacterium]|jgi:hypothetical protein|nr:hypothetical protein [Thermoanaerobaculia bacterium]